jgi:calcium-translocating P-type ATPase
MTGSSDRPVRVAWEALDVDGALNASGASGDGLSSDEAGRRLEEYGPNAIEVPPGPGPLRRFLDQFRSPLISILLVAAVITTIIGEYIDSMVIAAVLLINAIIGFVQESKASHAVEALMGMVAPHAHVLRDGRHVEIEAVDLVPGDIVMLESGMQVPGDLRLIETRRLAIDESMLTGESLPTAKGVAAVADGAAVADRHNMVFSGSVVTSGRGVGVTVATGNDTELGSIAAAMRSEARILTPLQQRMIRFAKVVGVVVAASALVTAVVGVMRGEAASDMFLIAVALAVSAIPEGLPVVFTITLAVGVSRMAARNAIVRRLPAVEALGSVTVIGSDKTGTLTQNRMTVREIWSAGEMVGEVDQSDRVNVSLESGIGRTIVAGVLASEASVDGDQESGDPTELALLRAASNFGVDVEGERARRREVDSIPFESDRGYSASIREGGSGPETFVKGAPERVIAMCNRMLGPAGEEEMDAETVLAVVADMAARGQRVLAMAWTPAAPESGADPENAVFLGLQAMLDPPRAGVADSVAGCKRAGIRVIMITGDHAETALAIAVALGIVEPDAPVVTGRELGEIDDAALDDVVRSVSVFARVAPEHKLRVVQALRRRGEMVAVTGDGVNDAPALRGAEIGIAMGRDGTDVAREAADIVLADDNFVSIHAAVEIGRVTFDNLRKATFFLISSGAAEVMLIVSALALGWPLPMLPAQLLWLNLVTNGLQDVALAFEPGERDVLDRPPRPTREGIVSRLLWERTVIAGLVMGAGTLWLFAWAHDATGSIVHAQSVALTTMVVFQAFHAGNSRSERRSLFSMSPFSNRFLVLAVVAAVGLHFAALYTPLLSAILRVEPLPLEAWVRIVLVALSVIVAMEVHKLVRRAPRSP